MDTPELSTLRLDIEGHVAWVTLSRPDKRNAMNPRMHEEMAGLIPRLNDDPELRAIVITGAGKSFCAGADIKEYFHDLEDKPDLRRKYVEMARHWMWDSLAQSPKATVCMINGHCFGGGLLVAMACDIAIAGDRAVFGLPEINWGHFPGGAASLGTIEMMGMRKALYWAMTGENFDAATAERDGLITRAVPHDDLEAEVRRVVGLLAGKSPAAIQTIKEVYRLAPRVGMEGIHDLVTAKLDQLRARDAGGLREKGMSDFMGKRLRTTTGA